MTGRVNGLQMVMMCFEMYVMAGMSLDDAGGLVYHAVLFLLSLALFIWVSLTAAHVFDEVRRLMGAVGLVTR